MTTSASDKPAWFPMGGAMSPAPEKCDHDYKETYSDFDKESYQCKKCGERYSLYYEDMQ